MSGGVQEELGGDLIVGLFHITNFPLNTKEEVSEMLNFSLSIMNKEEMKFDSGDSSKSVLMGAHLGIPDVISVCIFYLRPLL